MRLTSAIHAAFALRFIPRLVGCVRDSPARSVSQCLAVGHVLRRGKLKYARRARVHGTSADATVILDVEIFHALASGVPKVGRFANIVGASGRAHGMHVTQGLAVIHPREAMLVALLAVGEFTFPATSGEERHRFERIDGLRSRTES